MANRIGEVRVAARIGRAQIGRGEQLRDMWDEQTLDAYLTDPRKFMPGTKMVFAGLKNPEDRKALIEYLKEQY